jgi:CubicO group peptidase (beta-lactamase class C family)
MTTTLPALGTSGAAAATATYVRRLMKDRGIPGVALAVTDREGLLYAAGFGSASLLPSAAATPSTTYLWFSMSKLVTATAAVRLAEEGRLDLDAPFAEHLGHDVANPASVRQLLTHTAGLGNPVPIRWVHRADEEDRDDELLDRMLRRHARATHPVGGAARYSNVGYLLAGRVIESASGLPFRDYVHQAVLQPAGMHDTGYRLPAGVEAATGYVRVPRGAAALVRALLPAGVVGRRHDKHLALHPFLVDGAAYGGLVGPVSDAIRFARLHLRDGELDGQRVLSPAGARMMRDIHRKGLPFHHGVGWFQKPAASPGRPAHVEHFGAGAGFWNAMRLYPDVGLGMVVMANTTAAYDVDGLFETIRAHSWRSHAGPAS